MWGVHLSGQWCTAKSHTPTYHTSTQGPRSCQTLRKEFGTQRAITICPLPAEPSGPIQPCLPSLPTSATTLLPGTTGLSSPPTLFIPNLIQSLTFPDHSLVPQNQATIYQLPCSPPGIIPLSPHTASSHAALKLRLLYLTP